MSIKEKIIPIKVDDDFIAEKFKAYLNAKDAEMFYVYGYQEPSLWKSILYFGDFSPFANKHYLICLTNSKLLMIQVNLNYEEKDIRAIDFSEIERVKIKKTFMLKKITIYLRDGTRYRIYTNYKVGGIKKQKENLQYLCNFLEQFTVKQ